jgi:hypothetical protein
VNERVSLFETDPLDVTDFHPKTGPAAGPAAAEIDRIGQGKFQSREPNRPSTKRLPMVYRTGRNLTFSVKATPSTTDAFYAIATRMGWKANETFENAVQALSEKLERDKRAGS